jgi:hypothetical protein
MGDILRGLDYCFAYLDDILVFPRSLEEHEQHLRALFTQIQRYGIIINPAKCFFRAPEVTFLSYKVSADNTRNIVTPIYIIVIVYLVVAANVDIHRLILKKCEGDMCS